MGWNIAGTKDITKAFRGEPMIFAFTKVIYLEPKIFWSFEFLFAIFTSNSFAIAGEFL